MASLLTWMKCLFSSEGARSNDHTNGTATTDASPSHAERHAYWQSRQDITLEEHMAQWERQMDDWLAGLNAEQQAFVKRLLRADRANGCDRASER
jgi:hypothetical protein